MKGSSGCYPECCRRSLLFSIRVEPRVRKYLGWVGSTLCKLPGVKCQANGKPLFVSDDGEKPGAGEKVRKSLKIVQTNRRSHLESTSLSETRSKKSGAGERIRKDVKIVETNRRSPLESTKAARNEPKTERKNGQKIMQFGREIGQITRLRARVSHHFSAFRGMPPRGERTAKPKKSRVTRLAAARLLKVWKNRWPCHSERSEESAFLCFQADKCRCFA